MVYQRLLRTPFVSVLDTPGRSNSLCQTVSLPRSHELRWGAVVADWKPVWLLAVAAPLACGVALLAAAGGQPARAADMPVKAVAPAATVYSWTGCYIGAQVGAVQSNATWNYNGLNPYNANLQPGSPRVRGVDRSRRALHTMGHAGRRSGRLQLATQRTMGRRHRGRLEREGDEHLAEQQLPAYSPGF